jgi:beta-xylosidase
VSHHLLARLIIFLSAFIAACASPPQKQIIPPAPTPPPLNGSPVTKNTNVSFNTYSKEWPIGWEWIDPDRHPPTPHDTRVAVLHMTLPKGKDLSLELDTAPRYLKAIQGDFQIETKVVAHPVLNHQGAGLLIWYGEQDYVRFERASGGVSGIQILVRHGDDLTPIAATDTLRTDAGETWLRIRREGRSFTFLWRDTAKGEWKQAGVYTADYPASVLAGLVATNTADEFDVSFGYIRVEAIVKK